MPVLALEPKLYPDGLFDDDVALHVDDRRWWVLHTKPRQEKSVARRLCADGVSFFLPTFSRRVRVRGRVLHSQIPLFAGYVFLLGNRESRLAALTTNRVVRCLEVSDQDRFWSDLRQINKLLSVGLPIAPEERLPPGSPVEVICGPLAGLRGTVVRLTTGNRFVVAVDFIQRGASVVIDDFALEPLGLAAFSRTMSPSET